MPLDITAVLNILQALLSAPVDTPVYPWSVSTSTEALEETWYVHVKLPLDREPTDVFTELYWTIEANVERQIYPGLVVIEPRLVTALQLNFPGLPSRRPKHFLTFGLRLVGAGAHRIWGGLSHLEVENPFTLRESATRAKLVYNYLRGHALFGLNSRSVLQVRSVEVVLTSGSSTFTIFATRPNDPRCRLPLPRRLEEYDLAPNIRLTSFNLHQSRYHSSITDLICFWTFTFSFDSLPR